ncbi:hypothetical protein P692DRAFT_20804817 [Suillus brevipes Sb2]|nr:hypothetical protein P692DRAFT_20804817 [Suillus brevipes Sb2]
MSRYLRVGPGVLGCLPRSYYTWACGFNIISLCGPSQVFDDLDLSGLMEPLYLICTTISILKPQPCYTKPHSDSQHSASSLSIIFAASILMSTSILTYAASASSIAHITLVPRKHSTCRVNASSRPRRNSTGASINLCRVDHAFMPR